MIPVDFRRGLVYGNDAEFSITQQCKMLGIQLSGVNYKPAKASVRDLEIIKVMDALYMEDPALGTRRYRDDRKKLEHVIGRDKVMIWKITEVALAYKQRLQIKVFFNCINFNVIESGRVEVVDT